MNRNLRRIIVSGEFGGERGDLLYGAVGLLCIVRKDSHRGIQFTQDVHKISVGGKRDMARTSTGSERRREEVSCIRGARPVLRRAGCSRGGPTRTQRTFCCVKFVD